MNPGYTREMLIAFEEKVRLLWEGGDLPSLVHLSGGNEDALRDIFLEVLEQDWVFVSHRAHYHCLLKGMPEDVLLENIRTDRSMFCFDAERRIYQSAILGGCCGIAVGVAKAIQERKGTEKVWCFLGDGASDNGALYEAVLYATGHDLPIEFVVEDNGRQVDTTIEERRGKDHDLLLFKSPKIRHYYYTPTFPHAGSGCQHQITFKRLTPL
jgi:pyruvate dehydrogenase E1 component alpha subunit